MYGPFNAARWSNPFSVYVDACYACMKGRHHECSRDTSHCECECGEDEVK